MVELELLGLHSDGEHVTLTDADGQRYRLLIDDALRAAVRRDRPRLEQLQAAGESVLRPRDIQILVRAGASAEEVAEQAGIPVEHVRRYEGPVLAERGWVVQQARAVRINHEADAPQLGDLVLDRLAARGVPAASLDWDAVREKGQPWEVAVTFVADGREREARWRVDLSARSVHALDDEARSLSETEVGPGPVPARRRLSAVGPERRARVYDVETDEPAGPREASSSADPGPAPASTEAEPDAEGSAVDTDDLLAELAANRGTRVHPELELDEDDAGDPTLWGEGPGAHPAASRPEEATDAHVLPLRGPQASSADEAEEVGTTPALPADRAGEDAGEGAGEDATREEPPAPRRKPRRNNRRSVPSWDEIVFGARPE